MTGFTFAVITDTHIRAPGGDLSSPFPVNERANGRARHAVATLMANAPDLTIHLGDLVHPLPHMQAYAEAVAEAHDILSPLRLALHSVPGNHDIGDKPSPGMPAKSTTDESLATYRAAFGPDWRTFSHKGVQFVTINSSLVNSGLAAEAEQRDWLETTLAEMKDQRVFLFSHYPPFIASPDEQDHYDNYAEPGRSWLLNLAADNGVEAILSGHVHHFFYNRYREVKLFCLTPTSFTRQDYAEMFPDQPALEFGRDDRGKFGVMLVDVTEAGFSLRFAPTGGREDGDPEPLPQRRTPLIPHLRHAWFEPRSLPYNGPMEEFTRKRVRNDYPLLRLLQLGIDTVRTPLSDLSDPVGRARIEDWKALGLNFVLFRVGVPTAAEMALLKQVDVAALEILATRTDLSDLAGDFSGLIKEAPCPVWISKVTTSADIPRKDGVFAHAVSSGFLPDQAATLTTALQAMDPRPAGATFQVEWGADPAEQLATLSPGLAALDMTLVANIRLADSNPAVPNFDDARISAVLKAAIEAASQLPNVILQCDTFEDVDRGYNPRHGLIDRRCNLRDLV